jgi:hypothetical protein
MFYTYLWLREDGTPYYVGKGKGNRAYISFGHGVHCPPEKERIVIYPSFSEDEAFETEIILIWYYGRKDLGTGCLRNLTSGGENPPPNSHAGHTHSKDTKETLSKKVKALWEDEAYAEHMSKAHKGQVAWNKGKKHSQESINKMKASQKLANENPNKKQREWKHGTKTGYGNHRCRCEQCVKYSRDYGRERSKRKRRAKELLE